MGKFYLIGIKNWYVHNQQSEKTAHSTRDFTCTLLCVPISEFNMHFTALGRQVAVTIYFCLNSLPAPSSKYRKRADPGL